MPNWVYNTVIVKGRPQTLQRLAKFLQSGDSVFTFNNVIPCPEELLKDDWQSDKAKAAENVKNYGYEGWYDWRVAKWDTKWEACHPTRTSGGMKGTLIYSFDTAWSPPTAVIDEIARRYPSLEIMHEFHEEAGMYPSCRRFYQVGGETTEEEIPNINAVNDGE